MRNTLLLLAAVLLQRAVASGSRGFQSQVSQGQSLAVLFVSATQSNPTCSDLSTFQAVFLRLTYALLRLLAVLTPSKAAHISQPQQDATNKDQTDTAATAVTHAEDTNTPAQPIAGQAVQTATQPAVALSGQQRSGLLQDQGPVDPAVQTVLLGLASGTAGPQLHAGALLGPDRQVLLAVVMNYLGCLHMDLLQYEQQTIPAYEPCRVQSNCNKSKYNPLPIACTRSTSLVPV